jgi:ParB/RepB/Spo0J family partition protein
MNLSAINKVTNGKTRTTGITPFMEIPLEKVYANPEQPRKKFDDIAAFAKALKQDGLLQPIVVVKRSDGYMIVSGERRYQAHKYNNATTIKAHIIEADDHKILELSLIENIQRDDLTDYEIAMHISKLWLSKRYNSKKELAGAVGKSQTYLSKAFGCLNLHEDIRKDLEFNKREIGLTVLEELSRIKDKDMQLEPYKLYNDGEIKRDDIKGWRELQSPKKLKPVKAERKKYVSYGFGTVNEFGDLIAIIKGDLEGRISIDTQDIVKTANNCNYKITIEEI